MKWILKFIAAAIVLATAAPAIAQVQTGSILVKSVDEQGGVIPGVNVTLTGPYLVAGSMSGVSDSGGVYRFPSLPPGPYAVKLELQGFQTVDRQNIIVSVGQTTPLELTLKVATVTETVTVTGASPTVDTTSANVHVTLSQRLLQSTPGGRDIWSLVEYKVPGLISSRPDVGGASGGLQGSMVARGTPNGQNTQLLNGINVGDPAAIGFTGFYYDFDAFEEIQVSTGSHDMAVASAGVALNMVTKTGSNKWAGQGKLLYQNHSTQGSNIDDNLLTAGFRSEPPAAGSVDYVSDATFQLGGPLVQNKVRFFGSFRDWRVHVSVPGFSEIEETNITSGLGNATWQLNNANRFTGFFARQYYKKPNRGASALNNPTSNFREDDVLDITQALWNSVLSNRAFVDARFTFNRIQFPLFQKGSDQSLFDNATSFLDRAAQQEQVFDRRRFQGNANLQYYVDHALGGRHEIRVGFDQMHTPQTTQVHRIDDLNLFYNSTTPTGWTVTLFNSPVNSASTIDQTAVYLQDNYSVKRVTITGGVRWERVEGYLPAQSSPTSPWFPTQTRTYSEIRDIPNWKTLGPRVSVVIDASGDGRTAIKASGGRYYYTIGTGTPNTVNPNFAVSETYNWNDLNKDLRFTPNELGTLTSRAGGLITQFDPAVKRPYTDEASFGVDRELIANMKASAVVVYHRERDTLTNHDYGVPFNSFSLVSRVDPGRDGTTGTADDSTINVWNQDAATIGRNQLLVQNDAAFNQDYQGLELTVNKRYSNRWQMLAGYTVAKTIAKALPPGLSTPLTPNLLINAEGPIDFDRTHVFKLTGSYTLPYDINVSGNFRSQTGQPYSRTLRLSLNQGTVTVNAEPRGAIRLDYLTTLDLQVSKAFHVNGKAIEVNLDGYNLTNANTVYDIRNLTGRVSTRQGGIATGALNNLQQVGSPLSFLPPRILRLGVSFRF